MTIEERAAKAAELKATGACNCAQAVLTVFADQVPLDEDTLMKLGGGFAAGMGCMEATCGALIGAVDVAGLLPGGKGTPRTGRALLTEFQDRLYFGTDACNVDSDLMPFIRFFKTLRDGKKISGEVYDKIMFKNAQKLFEEN